MALPADTLPEGGGLSKEQKVIFVLLLVFAIMTVGLGILQIRNTMYAPFALNNRVPVSVKDQVNTVDALRYRDTDVDGLTDFDELYIYTTSPYLYDTFSYGMSDREVIEKGFPLCPGAGLKRNCAGVAMESGDSASSTEKTLPAFVQDLNPGPPPQDLTDLISNPAKIRSLLEESGVDPKIIAQINDQQLMALVEEALETSTFSNLKQLNSFISTSTKSP